MNIRRFFHHIAVAAMVCSLTAAPAEAEPTVVGTLHNADATFYGAWDVTCGATPHLRSRDVVELRRNGQSLGEAMVISTSGHEVIILPRARDVRKGDEVVFVRHASMDVFRREMPPVSTNDHPVRVTGRDGSTANPSALDDAYLSASTTSSGYNPYTNIGGTPGYNYGGYGYGSSGYGYGYASGYGVNNVPTVNGQTTAAPTLPGAVPHASLPSFSGSMQASPVYHPSFPSVAQPHSAFSPAGR